MRDRDLLTIQITELKKQLDAKEKERDANALLEKQFTQCMQAIPDATLLILIKEMKDTIKCDYAKAQLGAIRSRLG